ncbi:uncharacterized protein [Penaeus vannamei]|uniref:uncharacterized protein n=1 Tax=Penaeus vannamei TaxID=6689 RepID=UPI00387F8BAC
MPPPPPPPLLLATRTPAFTSICEAQRRLDETRPGVHSPIPASDPALASPVTRPQSFRPSDPVTRPPTPLAAPSHARRPSNPVTCPPRRTPTPLATPSHARRPSSPVTRPPTHLATRPPSFQPRRHAPNFTRPDIHVRITPDTSANFPCTAAPSSPRPGLPSPPLATPSLNATVRAFRRACT